MLFRSTPFLGSAQKFSLREHRLIFAGPEQPEQILQKEEVKDIPKEVDQLKAIVDKKSAEHTQKVQDFVEKNSTIINKLYADGLKDRTTDAEKMKYKNDFLVSLATKLAGSNIEAYVAGDGIALRKLESAAKPTPDVPATNAAFEKLPANLQALVNSPDTPPSERPFMISVLSKLSPDEQNAMGQVAEKVKKAQANPAEREAIIKTMGPQEVSVMQKFGVLMSQELGRTSELSKFVNVAPSNAPDRQKKNQEMLDKLPGNLKSVVGKLSDVNAQHQILRALEKMPGDLAALDAFAGRIAAIPGLSFDQALGRLPQLIARLKTDPRSVQGMGVTTADLPLFERLQANLVEVRGEMTKEDEALPQQPPKTEGERLAREMKKKLAVLSDPKASGNDKFAALMELIGVFSEMCSDFKGLSKPPKDPNAKPKPAPEVKPAEPNKPAEPETEETKSVKKGGGILKQAGFAGDIAKGEFSATKKLRSDTSNEGKDQKGNFDVFFKCENGIWKTSQTPPGTWFTIDASMQRYNESTGDADSDKNRKDLNKIFDELQKINQPLIKSVAKAKEKDKAAEAEARKQEGATYLNTVCTPFTGAGGGWEYSTGWSINLNPQFQFVDGSWMVRWKTTHQWSDPSTVEPPSSWTNNSQQAIQQILDKLTALNRKEY